MDAVWAQAHRDTQAFIAAHPLEQEGIAAYLRELVRPAASMREVVCRLRGAQAAFFVAGWLVRVDDERFAAVTEQEPYDLLNCSTAQALRAFVPPRFAAAATLALVLREAPAALVTAQVGDISADGKRFRFVGRNVAIPAEFSVFLRAIRMERIQAGADETAPLFVTSACFEVDEENVPVTERVMRDCLRTVVRETGLRVCRFSNLRVNPTSMHWQRARGIKTVALDAPRHDGAALREHHRRAA